MSAIELTESACFVLGLAGLAVGYSRNSRNLLLASALLAIAGLGLDDFASGFEAGLRGTPPAAGAPAR